MGGIGDAHAAFAGPPVCVLGFGRSGTSLTARALSLLGVSFGPSETMLPPSEWNPAGYWEQRAIMELNDEILAALGGTYYEPPPRPPGWHREPGMLRFHDRIATLVAEHFEEGSRWGFKDPRTALTLPLWRDVLGTMVYAVCVRDPLETAASHRVGEPQYDTEHFLGLWLDSNAEALRLTAGERRVFVLHHEWLEDPIGVAVRLVRLLDQPPDSLDDEARGAICASVDRALYRQRMRDPALVGNADVAVEVRAMAAVLAGLAAAESEAQAAPLQALGVTLDAAWRQQRGAEAAVEAMVVRLRDEVDRLHAALSTVESSRSWRITAPLRSVGARLRPPRGKTRG